MGLLVQVRGSRGSRRQVRTRARARDVVLAELCTCVTSRARLWCHLHVFAWVQTLVRGVRVTCSIDVRVCSS